MNDQLEIQQDFHEWVHQNIRECIYVATLCASTKPEDALRHVEMVVVPSKQPTANCYTFVITTLNTVWCQGKGTTEWAMKPECVDYKLELSCVNKKTYPDHAEPTSCVCTCSAQIHRRLPCVLSVWTLKFRILNSVRCINAGGDRQKVAVTITRHKPTFVASREREKTEEG